MRDLREGSAELCDAHANLQNIRSVLARPPGPRRSCERPSQPTSKDIITDSARNSLSVQGPANLRIFFSVTRHFARWLWSNPQRDFIHVFKNFKFMIAQER